MLHSTLSKAEILELDLNDKDIDPNYLLCKNLASLSVFCLWPWQNKEFLKNKKARSLHHACGVVIYCMFFIFLITEYVELVKVWGNLEDMTTNMSVSCLYTVGVMKIYAFFGHRQKLKDLISGISTMETNILKYQNDDIKSLLHAYVTRARNCTYQFWFLTGCTICVFFVIPPMEYRFSSTYHIKYGNGTEFWSYKRPMIFSSWFPFDKYAFPNYLIAYIYQVVMGIVGASYQAIWDTFIVTMMIHSIGQLQILQKCVEQITSVNKTRPELHSEISSLKGSRQNISMIKNRIQCKMDETAGEIKHNRLVHCVNQHRYIIRYTKNLNSIISPVMMVYFMVCSLMLCAIGFQASLVGFYFGLSPSSDLYVVQPGWLDDACGKNVFRLYTYGFSLRLCFMVEYLIAMMVQLFLFYWHGNEVVYESNKLLLSSYSCDWYTETNRFKNSFLIMRQGFELPIKYTVGPFYTMSLPTFLAILRASYSYFALLRQVQEDLPPDN